MAGSAPSATAAFEAERALEVVQAHPREALARAGAARARALAEGDAEALSVAERVLGLAAKELKRAPAAILHLRRAVRVAETAGLAPRAAQARMSLALALADRGQMSAALREVEAARDALSGLGRARAEMQRALILQRIGREGEALQGYRRAAGGLHRAGDRLWEARLRNNRGLLHAYRGALRAAEADLREAERLYAELGQALARADALHNLGFVAARAGDVPAALRLFDEADELCRANDLFRANSLIDRCEVLLSVHLAAEARRAAEQAARELARGGMRSDVAEARLMLSQALLLDGDLAAARREAERARRAFGRQGRAGWAALAHYAALRAQPQPSTRTALRVADELRAAGWLVPALDASLLAGRSALRRGDRELARRLLASVARSRRHAPVGVRVRAAHAHALLRLEAGNRRGAYAALRAGVRLLDEHRAALGATELRAHVSSEAVELARLGVRLALDGGRPERVLEWAERWRAGALRTRPVRPPDDRELAGDLAELRRVAALVEDAAAQGAPTGRLLAEQRALEDAIRRRTRRASGARGGLAAPPSRADLAGALGERALVEYVRLDGELHAVVLVGGRAHLHHAGAEGPLLAELDALRFALGRLARRRGSAASLDAARAAVVHATGRLDAALVAPLRRLLEERPLVLVPTGALHALPWAALPSLRGRPLTVSPSACVWHVARRRAARTDEAVLVAGPALPGARREVEDLIGVYPRARALWGSRARSDAVLSALDGAAVAHVAAHGRFRADNPLFSAVQLADGPLTVYDLEGLRDAPRTLVLSACDSGLSAVRPGDELMGLSAALLALGARTLVASILPLPDEEARPLVCELHRGLAAGLPAERALVAAQRTAGDREVAAAALVCIGA